MRLGNGGIEAKSKFSSERLSRKLAACCRRAICRCSRTWSSSWKISSRNSRGQSLGFGLLAVVRAGTEQSERRNFVGVLFEGWFMRSWWVGGGFAEGGGGCRRRVRRGTAVVL